MKSASVKTWTPILLKDYKYMNTIDKIANEIALAVWPKNELYVWPPEAKRDSYNERKRDNRQRDKIEEIVKKHLRTHTKLKEKTK